MTRAYIKLDPGFPERKEYYPDGPWRALVTLFCYASHQPTPGVFKSEKIAKVLLGKHGRYIPFLLDEKDLVKQRDGSVVVVGWQDWQEGSYPSVAARMEAIEKRRRPMSPADRAFLYRHRKRDVTAESDASRDGPVDVTLRNSDSTQPDSPRNAARLKKREDGTFEVVNGGAA
jgi:hypothetical protein